MNKKHEKPKQASESFKNTFLNFISKEKLNAFEFFHKRIAINQPDSVVPTAGARKPSTPVNPIAKIRLTIIPISANLNGVFVFPLEKYIVENIF